MVEVRKLHPESGSGSEPVVAYNNADGSVLYAHAGSGEFREYIARYGYTGTKEIVCIDCKEFGLEAPLSFVDPKAARAYFRHQSGMAPAGTGRHGETAQHIYGKHLIAEWARGLSAVVPESVVEEQWVPGIRLRSDVRATLQSGKQVAFEIQRRPLGDVDWARRHGGYSSSGVNDVWLWAPTVGVPRMGQTKASVVFDVEDVSLGVFVADYPGVGYRHPCSQPPYRTPPTHYAAAPLEEWSVSQDGWLIPPPEMEDFLRPPQAVPVRRKAQPAVLRERGPAYEDRLRVAVLNRLRGSEKRAIEAPLGELAVCAPATFRSIGRHMVKADASERALWVAALQHGNRELLSGYRRVFADFMRLQVGVVTTVLALTSDATGDIIINDRYALWKKATENVLDEHNRRSDNEARAITYAVWATGHDPTNFPNPDRSSIDLIAKNLQTLIARKTAVQVAMRGGKQLREAVTEALALPVDHPVAHARQIIARRAQGDEYFSIKRSLDRLSRISPESYIKIGERFEDGDDREVLLWVDALMKRERHDSDAEFVEYIRTQAAVIRMIMVLVGDSSTSGPADGWDAVALGGLVEETIAKLRQPMTVPRVWAVTYAVWAYGTGKHSWLVEANDKSAIDFIEANLTRLVERRAQVEAARDAKRTFQQTIDLLRTLVGHSRT